MKRKMLISIALLVSLAAIISVAGCARHAWHGMSPAEKAEKVSARIADHISDELDFTKEQDMKLQTIRKDVVAKFREQEPRRKAMHEKAMNLLKQDTITEVELNRLYEDHRTEQESLKPFITAKIIEFHKILTPEQKITLAEKMKKYHKF